MFPSLFSGVLFGIPAGFSVRWDGSYQGKKIKIPSKITETQETDIAEDKLEAKSGVREERRVSKV